MTVQPSSILSIKLFCTLTHDATSFCSIYLFPLILSKPKKECPGEDLRDYIRVKTAEMLFERTGTFFLV